MKLLIGLSLPDPVSSHLGTLRGSLSSVHWIDPDCYQIALCFIGKIQNHHLINDLDQALDNINCSNFELTIQGVNHLTSSTDENYFNACVLPTYPLSQLKKKIEHTLHCFDIKLNKQRFIPHITIAKGIGINEEQISNWLYKYNLFKTEPFKIHQFSLFSSYANKHHPHYITETNYLLR